MKIAKRTTRFRQIAFLGVVLCVAGACGMGENRQKAEAAVVTFHDQLNASHLDEIYSGTVN